MPITIHTDSQSALLRSTLWRRAYSNLTTRQILKTPMWNLWEQIAFFIDRRSSPVNIIKVKAHSGIALNEEADRLARNSATFGAVRDECTFACPDETRIFFQLRDKDNYLIDTYPRKWVLHALDNAYKVSWLFTNRGKYASSIIDLSDDTSCSTVLDIFHIDGKPRGGYTRSSHCNFKSYYLKLITNTLPTMKLLNDKWHIYETSKCPCCNYSDEDAAHMWTCPGLESQRKEALLIITGSSKNSKSWTDNIMAIGSGRINPQLIDFVRKNSSTLEPVGFRWKDFRGNMTTKIFIHIIDTIRTIVWQHRSRLAQTLQIQL